MKNNIKQYDIDELKWKSTCRMAAVCHFSVGGGVNYARNHVFCPTFPMATTVVRVPKCVTTHRILVIFLDDIEMLRDLFSRRSWQKSRMWAGDSEASSGPPSGTRWRRQQLRWWGCGPLETEVHLFIGDGAMIASRHRGLEKKRVAGSIFILLVALGWEPWPP